MTDLRAMVRDREAMHRRAQKAEALLPGLHHWFSAIVNVWKRNPNNENRLQAAFAEQGLAEIAKHEADRYGALDPAAFERAVAEAVEREPHGIYVASKAKHGPMWQLLRSDGAPIISTWIDESGEGETLDWPDLWSRCVSEAASCAALVVYREEGEELKGAWVEVGAALSKGRPVFAVGIDAFSVRHHPQITICASLGEALSRAAAIRKGDTP